MENKKPGFFARATMCCCKGYTFFYLRKAHSALGDIAGETAMVTVATMAATRTPLIVRLVCNSRFTFSLYFMEIILYVK
jgi:hypothetical protein